MQRKLEVVDKIVTNAAMQLHFLPPGPALDQVCALLLYVCALRMCVYALVRLRVRACVRAHALRAYQRVCVRHSHAPHVRLPLLTTRITRRRWI